jgi:transcriptional regulator with XRE-family HTH domain
MFDYRKVSDEMIFAEKLKKERKDKGWSKEELAEKLFVSRQSVSKWENC